MRYFNVSILSLKHILDDCCDNTRIKKGSFPCYCPRLAVFIIISTVVGGIPYLSYVFDHSFALF